VYEWWSELPVRIWVTLKARADVDANAPPPIVIIASDAVAAPSATFATRGVNGLIGGLLLMDVRE
jgi:hypothetical protein